MYMLTLRTSLRDLDSETSQLARECIAVACR